MAKKSYKGFVIWLLVFVVGCVVPVYLPIENVGLMIRFILAFCAVLLAVLAFMIFKNGHVYWYNTITYEDVIAAGAERCMVFAFRLFVRFGIFAAGYVALSLIMWLLKVPFWVDIVIFSVGLPAVAISTTTIKL